MLASYRDRLWIVRQAVAIQPVLCAVALLVVLVSAALPLASIAATGALVGAVPAAVRDGLTSSAGTRATQAWLVFALLMVANRLIAPIRGTLGLALKQALDQHMERRVIHAVADPPGIAHLEDPVMLDRLSMAQGVGNARYTPGDVVAGLIAKAPILLQGYGAAIIVAGFRWWLAPLLLAAWAWATTVGLREIVNGAAIATRVTRALRRSAYLRDLALNFGAAREIRVFGLAGWLLDRFSVDAQRAIEPIWADRRRGGRDLLISAFPVVVVQSFAYALAGWAAVSGELSLAGLTFYIGAIAGVGILGARGNEEFQLAYGTAAVPALRHLEPAPRPVLPTPTTDLPPRLSRGIQLDSVSFRYPGQHQDVLSNLDLFIPAGRSLALVGVNGAGKTTLVKLLCRLYEPTAGTIAADGTDVRSVDSRAWRSHLSAIFQDFIQYPLTLRENVAFGGIDAQPGDVRLDEIMARTGASQLLDSLPRGWDTILSREFTDGVDLSGGQWQQVALARAVFGATAGADVLILDEPTANLDVRAEAALYDRFLDITAGLTTIVISHRFSTVRRADRIVVLDRGRITEDGTHDALMALGGAYARMFTLQASRFVETTEVPRADGAATADA